MREKTVPSYGPENRRLRAVLLVPLLLVFVAAALPATSDAAPPELVAFIDLTNNNVGPLLIPVPAPPAVGLPVTQLSPLVVSPNPANTTGHFFMTTVKIDLTGFKKACFTLEYEGTPVGWSFHVGDDVTNDGFGGGGPGLSSSVAEVQILDEDMAMYTIALGPGAVDRLVLEKLNLGNGAFKVCVSDDLVTWGNPAGGIDTTNSKIGFQIPDTAPATGFSPAGNGNRDIFAGFNRVVNGAARNGVGLARVLITLE